MVLLRMMTIQLVQNLDNVGVGTGPAELVSCTIEAKDELVRLFDGLSPTNGHFVQLEERNSAAKEGSAGSPRHRTLMAVENQSKRGVSAEFLVPRTCPCPCP
jgi:hypothetical protein